MPDTWPDPRDPRDAAFDAAMALGGVVELLGEGSQPVGRPGLFHLLGLIEDRLTPAAEALLAYRPRD